MGLSAQGISSLSTQGDSLQGGTAALGVVRTVAPVGGTVQPGWVVHDWRKWLTALRTVRLPDASSVSAHSVGCVDKALALVELLALEGHLGYGMKGRCLPGPQSQPPASPRLARLSLPPPQEVT